MKNKKIKQQVGKYYDDRIRQFSYEALASKEKRMKPLYEKVSEFAEINPNTIVGIIGSSTGSLPLFVASHAKKVIGVDLSKESLNFAKRRTNQLGVTNIEYKKGDAEALPLEENSIDVALSDCVINLVPDKQKAFEEIYRTLKPGGSLVIADPVRKKPFAKITNEPVGGCIAGTVAKEDYEEMLTKAGFDRIEITNITDLARKVFVGHEDKFDKYSLDYVIIKATKPEEPISRSSDEVKEKVRERYGKIAQEELGCSCGSSYSASSGVEDYTKKIGYKEEELPSVPEGANLGLGCGNPVALASLKEGDVVLDLGSGAGFDAFLAAQRVGKSGKVIGVDMTPEMIKKAKENAKKGSFVNVEFRLGEIENLPVADNSVDVVISNCVINLSPAKDRVFKEACRVLKRGGRLMVSDIVLEHPLPIDIKDDIEAYVGCIAGASLKQDYLNFIKNAGFKKVNSRSSNLPFEDNNDGKERINQSRIGSSLLGKFNGNVQKVIEIRKSIKSVKVSATKL